MQEFIAVSWSTKKNENAFAIAAVPEARGGADDYVNFVIFEEKVVSKSLSNFKKTIW